MNSAFRMRRTLWNVVILLALIGVAVVVRRTINLVPILINGYHTISPQRESCTIR
jgi:hypothetical protein